jgi:hypothetical protein
MDAETMARKGTLHNRRMPEDLHAEAALLGALLLSTADLAAVRGQVTVDSFMLPDHGRVWRAVCDLVDRGSAVDVQLVAAEVEHRTDQTVADLIDSLLKPMTDGVASAANVKHYANLVADHARRRTAIMETQRLAEAAYSNNGEFDAALERSIDVLGQCRGDGQAPTMQAVIQVANDIEERPVSWLWPNRLEAGALNLLAGDPGSTKSLLTAAIAAAVSTGAAWPDRRQDWVGQPQNVIIVASEDDPAKATRPRLRAAGADLARIAIVRNVAESGIERQLCLQRDLAAIEQAIIQIGEVALVVIDPVDSYLGKLDSNANEEMRQLLEPVAHLAEKHSICFLVVKHLNKATGTASALYRIAGTMAFVALPRAVHIVGTDPDDKKRRLLMPLKISHGLRPDALAYRVEPNEEGLPVILWEADAVDADADDVLARKPGKSPKPIDKAVAWLRDVLTRDGPQGSKDLRERAEATGIASRTLDRAKERLGVVAEPNRENGKVGSWTVALPPTERSEETLP